MKPTPITLSATSLTTDDYVALNFRLWQLQPATRGIKWRLGLLILLLSLSVGLDVLQNGRLEHVFVVIFLGVLVVCAFSLPLLTRYQLRRGYARNPMPAPSISYLLTDTEVIQQSPLGTFPVQWPKIQRAMWVGHNWLLLYPNELGSYYLDMRRLQPPATPAEVAALLTRHNIAQQQL
ncbi:hypothetical protein ACFPAF_15345 [Hymenobacter endophyticus]|uniref:YcxB family protein n=1 Tax=Hymenobacter endophyticus TaxID=3076335 RepID=A0ABU3TK75_9BACT|nr:hypothetical protein [Hymenobacter endophyticus]MDU0371777.1 hypothetical protein [Hymenobacter endophyticus]